MPLSFNEREYIKQEISRRAFDSLPRDSLGRRIVQEPNRIISNGASTEFVERDWMPYMGSMNRNLNGRTKDKIVSY